MTTPAALGPTVAFLGLFGSPNLGNEATLEAFLHNVTARLPGARFACVAPRHSSIEREYGIPLLALDPYPVAQRFWRVRPAGLRQGLVDLAQHASEPLRRRRAGELLDGMAVLVMPGTGLIDDFGQRALDMPTHLDRWTGEAQRLGIPLAYLSVGVSTVKGAASRRLFQRSLARAAQCTFRDAVSLDNARALGYAGAGSVIPDLAFSLPAESLPRERPAGPRRVVGVGVMGYFGWNQSVAQGEQIYERYLAKLCTLVDALLADGHDVHLLIGDARADNTTVAAVMQRCSARAPSGASLLAPPIADFRDVLARIACTDVVVASRFHNVLLSLILQRPAVSIGYSDKNDALMADFGLQRFCHNIETFEAAPVVEQLRGLLERPGQVLEGLGEKLIDARARLDAQYDAFCSRWGRR